MSSTAQETADEIGRRLGLTYWAIDGAIRRADVRPVPRYGTVRVFSAEGVAAIEAELDRVQSKRQPCELVGAA